MVKKESVTTRITRTTTLDLTDDQINDALLEHFGFQTGKVCWDIGEGYIRSATIVSTNVEDL